jgi:hypothetical protein
MGLAEVGWLQGKRNGSIKNFAKLQELKGGRIK